MMLVSIMATLLPPLAVIPVHAVIQMNSNFSRAIMLWRHVTLAWMMPFVKVISELDVAPTTAA